MHMANELLSVPVAAGTLGIAAAGLGFVCSKAKQMLTSEKLPLMGVLGAFVFAAQMVNFQLPLMPGTSGHMVGAVLLAVILGPYAGTIVISSVVIIQCLIFQDGGLLALGCNIINMGLVPCFLGYYIYRALAANVGRGGLRLYIAAVIACTAAMEAGAGLVVAEAGLSNVLVVPAMTFLVTMLGVHLLVGACEGLITAAVLAYLQQVRPDLVLRPLPGRARLSKKAVLASLAVATVVVGAGLSLLASELPDGLEWSYADRPDQPAFKPVVSNDDPKVAAVDEFQSKYTPLPDYSARGKAAAGWTSFAAVTGSGLTMLVVWLAASLLARRRKAGTRSS